MISPPRVVAWLAEYFPRDFSAPKHREIVIADAFMRILQNNTYADIDYEKKKQLQVVVALKNKNSEAISHWSTNQVNLDETENVECAMFERHGVSEAEVDPVSACPQLHYSVSWLHY